MFVQKPNANCSKNTHFYSWSVHGDCACAVPKGGMFLKTNEIWNQRKQMHARNLDHVTFPIS